MYCNKYNSLDKDTDLSSEIENNYMVFFYFYYFSYARSPQTRLKATLDEGLQ